MLEKELKPKKCTHLALISSPGWLTGNKSICKGGLYEKSKTDSLDFYEWDMYCFHWWNITHEKNCCVQVSKLTLDVIPNPDIF